ncbi:MAG: BsuBI/PstI family type II restriction endonuclease [bacterium]
MPKIKDAIDILKEIGLPKAQQNERSSLTLLALLNLKENVSWSESKKRIIRIHDILVFIQENYGKKYAENTRETIRRQTLHQFEQAGIVARNTDDSSRPTNSPNTVYTITDEALEAIGKYGTSNWQSALQKFVKNKGKLSEKYEKRRKELFIPLELPDGTSVKLSPGKHNELQVQIINQFQTRFCKGAKLVYLGDTAIKELRVEKALLEELKIPMTKHDKLPDVILYDSQKNQLFLIEAVTAHGPVSPKRQMELEEVLKECKAKKIYISAFPDFHEFKKYIDNIAWETEVWLADNPDHMIHFNGDKFLNV